jgi:hypothetical protein
MSEVPGSADETKNPPSGKEERVTGPNGSRFVERAASEEQEGLEFSLRRS